MRNGKEFLINSRNVQGSNPSDLESVKEKEFTKAFQDLMDNSTQSPQTKQQRSMQHVGGQVQPFALEKLSIGKAYTLLKREDQDRLMLLPADQVKNDSEFLKMANTLAQMTIQTAEDKNDIGNLTKALRKEEFKSQKPGETPKLECMLKQQVSAYVGRYAVTEMKHSSPVQAGPPGEIPRVASDVLVHLMALLRQHDTGLQKSAYKKLDTDAMALFLSHRVSVRKIKQLIGRALNFRKTYLEIP